MRHFNWKYYAHSLLNVETTPIFCDFNCLACCCWNNPLGLVTPISIEALLERYKQKFQPWFDKIKEEADHIDIQICNQPCIHSRSNKRYCFKKTKTVDGKIKKDENKY